MFRRLTNVFIILAFLTLALPALGRDFRAAGNYKVGSHPVALVTGDFNADGRLDLAVANSGSRTITVLLGAGDGTFQGRVDFAVGLEPRSLAVTDIDGDGRADLAVADESGGRLSVLLGNGDGSFQPHAEFSASEASRALLSTLRSQPRFRSGAHFVSVATGDFNGDGKLDQAVASSGSDRVSILLGSETQEPAGSTNLIQNPNFATGTLSPWAVGRNYCSTGCNPWRVSHVDPYYGPADAVDTGNIEIVQDFSGTATSSITAVTFWIRHASSSSLPTAYDFFYADGTDDEYVVFTTDASWTGFNVTSNLASGETLDGFSAWGFQSASGSQLVFLDAVDIAVD